MEDLIKVLATSITIITFILTQYNSEQKRLDEMKKKYFEEVLIKFMYKQKYNENFNALKFIKRHYTLEDYYIPSYIFYLVDNNEQDKLKKVLKNDYCEYFPNNHNSIFNSALKLGNSVNYIAIVVIISITTVIFISAFFSFCGFVLEVIRKFSSINIVNIFNTITILLLLGSVIMVAKFFITKIEDDYTLDEKKIQKNIKFKLNGYEKKNNTTYMIKSNY